MQDQFPSNHFSHKFWLHLNKYRFIFSVVLTHSLNITARYCAVIKQTGCVKIDFADLDHDPTGVISEITTRMKKIPALSSVLSIKSISGSVCVSGNKHGIKAITEVPSVSSSASTPSSVSVSRFTTRINAKPGISPAVSNDKHSGSASIISHGWQAAILILLINILLMY